MEVKDDRAGVWPTIKKIKKWDQEVGEKKSYKKADAVLNYCIISGALILLIVWVLI